ncbi:MAG: hypothetical protein AB7U82_22155 [Blastocatellales bacterium]
MRLRIIACPAPAFCQGFFRQTRRWLLARPFLTPTHLLEQSAPIAGEKIDGAPGIRRFFHSPFNRRPLKVNPGPINHKKLDSAKKPDSTKKPDSITADSSSILLCIFPVRDVFHATVADLIKLRIKAKDNGYPPKRPYQAVLDPISALH